MQQHWPPRLGLPQPSWGRGRALLASSMEYSVPSAAWHTEQLVRGGRLTILTPATSEPPHQASSCLDGDLPFVYVIGEAEAFEESNVRRRELKETLKEIHSRSIEAVKTPSIEGKPLADTDPEDWVHLQRAAEKG